MTSYVTGRHLDIRSLFCMLYIKLTCINTSLVQVLAFLIGTDRKWKVMFSQASICAQVGYAWYQVHSGGRVSAGWVIKGIGYPGE